MPDGMAFTVVSPVLPHIGALVMPSSSLGAKSVCELANADGNAGRPAPNLEELVCRRDTIDAYAGAYLPVGIGTRFFEPQLNQQSGNINVHRQSAVPSRFF